jgi:hypothetical protein
MHIQGGVKPYLHKKILTKKLMKLLPVADLSENNTEKTAKGGRVRHNYNGKRMPLEQLSKKRFTFITLQNPLLQALLGKINDNFDIIVFGKSGSGKSNLVAEIIEDLVISTNERCDYVSYEEGHGATTQETLIHRHNLLQKLGNKMAVWDSLSFDDLVHVMAKKNSPKIWVIDSLQTSGFTVEQTKILRQKFILGRKKKIIIWVSWSESDIAKGAIGQSVQYWAHIKILVKGKIAFPVSSRFGGNKNFIIWPEGALKAWGKKLFNKHRNS